jgi:tetratricopeptide (TPR) repeat protein
MFRFLLILLLCLAECPLSGQSGSDEHQDRVLQLLESGDLRGAESELKKALQITPSDAALIGTMGSVLGMEGKLRESNGYLAKAVDLEPSNPLYRRNLAANQLQLGRFKEARANLDVLLKLNRDDRVATYLLGMVEEREKHYARSIELLNSVPDIVERRPEARVALESSLYHTGQMSKAQQVMHELLLQAVDPGLKLQAAGVSAANGDYATAEKALTKLMETDSTANQARSMLAEVLFEKASAELREQLYNDAVASYSQVLTLNPGSTEAARGRATAEWRAGMRSEATGEFGRLVHASPTDAPTLTAYGTLLMEEGTPDAAAHGIQLMRAAIAADERMVEPRFQLAMVELERGEAGEALSQLKAAEKLDPQSGRVHYALSRAYRQLNRTSEADRELALFRRLRKPEASANQQHPALSMGPE